MEPENRGNVLRGIASLSDMICCIGASEMNDHDVAKILVENELALRALVLFAIGHIWTDMR